jgi:AcrR family transcriptional regulator
MSIEPLGEDSREASPADVLSPRDRLLDAAILTINEVGEIGLTVQQVAKRAGLTTGAIYSNFGDRAGLIGAAYGERGRRRTADESTIVSLAAQIFTTGPEDVDAAIRVALAMGTPESRARRVDALEGVIAAEHNAAARAAVTPVVKDVIARVDELVQASQAAGQTVDDLDSYTIAAAFVGAAMGLTAIAVFIDHESSVDSDRTLGDVYLQFMHAFKIEPWTARIADVMP